MLLIKDLVLPNSKKVNFSLDEGSLMMIHGPNGSGKSLLLKSIALLEKVQFNEFIFQNVRIQDWKPEQYRSKVLYVPSSTFNLDMTVEEYLNFPSRLAVYGNAYDPAPALKIASQYQLTNQSLKLLSMGQRQILSLIRALNLHAVLLLLDEPTSHLDPQMVSKAHQLILDWKKRTGGSVVMVGHDEDEAKDLGVRGVQFEEFVG